MDAFRAYRTQFVREDAAEGGRLFARRPKRERPDWHCECGAHNDGWRDVCGYCGNWREDVDEL